MSEIDKWSGFLSRKTPRFFFRVRHQGSLLSIRVHSWVVQQKGSFMCLCLSTISLRN